MRLRPSGPPTSGRLAFTIRASGFCAWPGPRPPVRSCVHRPGLRICACLFIVGLRSRGGCRAAAAGGGTAAAAFSWLIFAISSAGSAPNTVVEHLLRVGPGAVAVRVVGLEHDVVDADGVARRRASTGRRSCRTRSCGAAPRPGAGRPGSSGRSPTGRRCSRAGRAASRPSRCRPPTSRSSGRGTSPGSPTTTTPRTRSATAARTASRRAAPSARPFGMSATPVEPTCRQIDGVGLRARLDDRVPPAGEDRLHVDAVRLLGQRHRGEPARRVAPDLVRAVLGIAEVA